MLPKLRPVLLMLSLVIAGSFACSSPSHAQLNDPPDTGGTKSRYVGSAPSASPWITLGNNLRGSQISTAFGSFTWAAVRSSQWSIATRGPLPARQLSR